MSYNTRGTSEIRVSSKIRLDRSYRDTLKFVGFIFVQIYKVFFVLFFLEYRHVFTKSCTRMLP